MSANKPGLKPNVNTLWAARMRYAIREYAMGRANTICDKLHNRLRAMSNCKVAFSATTSKCEIMFSRDRRTTLTTCQVDESALPARDVGMCLVYWVEG